MKTIITIEEGTAKLEISNGRKVMIWQMLTKYQQDTLILEIESLAKNLKKFANTD